MPYLINAEAQYRVGEQLHQRLRTYHSALRELRTELISGDDATLLLRIPLQNKAFGDYVTLLQTTYTNAQLKQSLEAYLTSIVTMSDVLGLINAFATIASNVENNTTVFEIIIDSTSKHVGAKFKSDSGSQAVKTAILEVVNTTLALFTE